MRNLIFVLLAAGVLVGPAAPACACSSCPTITEAEALQRADLVVEGVVTDLDTVFRTTATVRVDTVVKGHSGSQVTVRTPPSGNPCANPPPTEGHRHRLYLSKTDDGWSLASCSASRRLSAEPVLPWWRIHNELLTGGALVLLVGILLGLWGRRRFRTRASVQTEQPHRPEQP